jgi:hypothetical protein
MARKQASKARYTMPVECKMQTGGMRPASEERPAEPSEPAAAQQQCAYERAQDHKNNNNKKKKKMNNSSHLDGEDDVWVW